MCSVFGKTFGRLANPTRSSCFLRVRPFFIFQALESLRRLADLVRFNDCSPWEPAFFRPRSFGPKMIPNTPWIALMWFYLVRPWPMRFVGGCWSGKKHTKNKNLCILLFCWGGSFGFLPRRVGQHYRQQGLLALWRLHQRRAQRQGPCELRHDLRKCPGFQSQNGMCFLEHFVQGQTLRKFWFL